MKDFLSYRLFEFGKYVVTIESLVIILIIYVATRISIFFFTRLFNRMAERRKMEEGRRYSFLMLMRYFLWIISISLMISSTGVKLTFLIASSAALLVGVGLGLQRVFSDFTSGILLLFDGTIKRGDILQVGDMVGVIEIINLRTTILRDRNDLVVIVPNHKFTEENVINWSHNASITRFVVKVGVSYGSDMEKVRDILIACAAKHPHVTPKSRKYESSVRLAEFGDSSVNFELLFYSENLFRIESTKSDIRFMIWHAFKEQGVHIPYPQRDLHIITGSMTAKTGDV